MLTAVVGIQWGDEGKGRMVDLLSERYGVVARYQGGNNAGHTVINDRGKFILNLLPSGILREGVTCVMGCGMVIDPAHLISELERLRQAGVTVTPERLKISGAATMVLPCHVRQDALEEERLGAHKFGSTRRGIAYAYGDKYMKKALRMGGLLDPRRVKETLAEFVAWKNLTLKKVYGADAEDANALYETLCAWGEVLSPYLADTGKVLSSAIEKGKDVLFEAQLGALRDVDYGIYPYTSSSTTLAAYAPVGAGLPGAKLDHTVGVMKAYSTCVGEGPFVAELSGPEAERLRAAGGEYGAATGRPRRVGWFDVPASRYGVAVQGANALALTKLDVLSYLDEIPVITAYETGGERSARFPRGRELWDAKPVYETLPGWKQDISGCRHKRDLPKNARAYIARLEEAVSCKIACVSVGPGREDYLEF